MSKIVAIIGGNGEVTAINVQHDDYVLVAGEVKVGPAGAWVGGDYVGGHFYPPRPFASWTRGDGGWLAPVPMPETEGMWSWDEDSLSWVDLTPAE